MAGQREGEVLEGFVVDLACLRRYPQAEIHERGVEHTRDCCLHGHCIESGFGLVADDGRVLPLDDNATRAVVRAVEASRRMSGLRLRVTRERHGEEMQTTSVEEVPGT